MNYVGTCSEAQDTTGNALSSLQVTRTGITAGDVLWLAASWAGASSTATPTDTQNNSWQLIDSQNVGHVEAHWWCIAKASGSNTLTLTPATTFTFPGLFLSELAGVNAVAGHAPANLSGTQSGLINGTAITIPGADLPVFFLSWGQDNSVNDAPLAATGAGWTSNYLGGNFFGTNSTAIESQVFSSGSSLQSAWTAAAGNNGYGFLDVAFYQQSSSGGSGANTNTGSYSSSQPAVASSTALVNCRAILCTTAGSISYQQGPIGAPGPVTTIAMTAGELLPISLTQGFITNLGGGAYELLA